MTADHMATPARLTAAQAAARLGVKPATLYAYVSRGLLHSLRAGDGRASSFDAAEVERLAARARRAVPPSSPTGQTITSALTQLADDTLFYRGEDALRLARTRLFEEVADWLWTGVWGDRPVWRAEPVALQTAGAAQAALPPSALPLDRMRLALAAAAPTAPDRADLRPERTIRSARAIVALLAGALPPLRPDLAGPLSLGGGPTPAGVVAARLWVRLCPFPPEAGMLDALNAALVLLADHELAASTLAARVAASMQADPWDAAAAGLGVLGGALHGAASLAAEDLLHEAADAELADGLIGARLRAGEAIPGFGHPLYRAGDPRAPLLLNLLRHAAPPARLAVTEAVLEAMRERGLPPPNIDVALAALVHATGMVRGAGPAIFAVARTAGWLAHAREEYARPTTYRLRAVYTGATAKR